MRKSTTTKIIKTYRPRIKGICKAADDLGYSYRHLSKVLRGERHSPKALAAYRAYQQSQKQINSKGE